MGTGAGLFQCEVCRKQHTWRPDIAGRKVRCGCGQVMVAPRQKPEAVAAPVVKAGPAPDELRAPRAKAEFTVSVEARLAAERIRKKADADRREREEADSEIPAESTLRDFIIPGILIAVGIVLMFVEAMIADTTPRRTFSNALPAVAKGVVVKAVLMLAGIFVAWQFMEVTLLGAPKRNIVKLIAIAIGPAAVKGLLLHAFGEGGGSIVGVIASVALYILLFRLLLKTDARDTAICVTVTWVLLTMADFMLYKMDTFVRDVWF